MFRLKGISVVESMDRWRMKNSIRFAFILFAHHVMSLCCMYKWHLNVYWTKKREIKKMSVTRKGWYLNLAKLHNRNKNHLSIRKVPIRAKALNHQKISPFMFHVRGGKVSSVWSMKFKVKQNSENNIFRTFCYIVRLNSWTYFIIQFDSFHSTLFAEYVYHRLIWSTGAVW